MSKAQLVVTAVPNPNEMESVQVYMEGVLQLLTAAGGEMVVRAQADKPIKGELNFGFLLLMNFESKEIIENILAVKTTKPSFLIEKKVFRRLIY